MRRHSHALLLIAGAALFTAGTLVGETPGSASPAAKDPRIRIDLTDRSGKRLMTANGTDRGDYRYTLDARLMRSLVIGGRFTMRLTFKTADGRRQTGQLAYDTTLTPKAP